MRVVGQELGVGLAGERRPQVAVLAAHLQPALGVDLGRDGRVLVLGDVPVPGQGELEAALAGRTQRGREEARLAGVVDREGKPGGVEDRHAEEIHGGIPRRAHLPLAVDLQLAHLEHPVLARHGAGRVLGAHQAALLVGLEDRELGRAARGVAAGLGLRDREDGLLHLAGSLVDAVEEAGAGDGVARPLQAHVAGGQRRVVHDVVVQPVGEDRRAALADRDVAGRGEVLRLVARDAVGRQEAHGVALDPRRRRREPPVQPQRDALVRSGRQGARAGKDEREDAAGHRGSGVARC